MVCLRFSLVLHLDMSCARQNCVARPQEKLIENYHSQRQNSEKGKFDPCSTARIVRNIYVIFESWDGRWSSTMFVDYAMDMRMLHSRIFSFIPSQRTKQTNPQHIRRRFFVNLSLSNGRNVWSTSNAICAHFGPEEIKGSTGPLAYRLHIPARSSHCACHLISHLHASIDWLLCFHLFVFSFFFLEC